MEPLRRLLFFARSVRTFVHFGIRESVEQRERETLSPHAMLSAESHGRTMQEEPDRVRTCFQRDRDRILHSKAFRRLKHKTQVFIAPLGDHYRTRLTHSLEVAQIARTIGRALSLNEDLIEAIALGHDVGHTPFGHAGEEALDRALREHGVETGFRHHEQSYHLLVNREPLNLTQEVLQGIAGHSKGRANLTEADGTPTSSLEASVVRISDRIAYLNADLDDAVRSGMIASVPGEFAKLGPTHGKRVTTMVQDVIEQSFEQPVIRLSDEVLGTMNELKEWLFENVYLQYPVAYPDTLKAQALVQELFRYYVQPENAPQGYEGLQGAIDYVAGMTDRFAISAFRAIRLPAEFPELSFDLR